MEDFGCDRVEAKALRNSIPSCKGNGHVVNESGHEDIATGEWVTTNERVAWFYDLREFVVDRIRLYGGDTLHWSYEERTPHLVLTFLEQKVMTRIWRGGDVVARMHDGAIFSSCDEKKLEKLAYPHLIKIERW
jgi:hypothetical protein